MYIKPSIQPQIVAYHGDTYGAPDNGVNSIQLIAQTGYTDNALIEIVMTKDEVLVANQSMYCQNIAFDQSYYEDIKDCQVGQNYLQLDPQYFYTESYYNSMSMGNYNDVKTLYNVVQYETVSNFSDILRQSVIKQLQIIIEINSDDRYDKIAEQLIDTLEQFGLTSIDKAYMYQIKTNSYELYKILSYQYPFMRFMLPIESLNWNVKQDNLTSDEHTFYFSLREYNKAIKILNNNTFTEIPIIILTGVNSQFLITLSRSMNIDKAVTNIDLVQITDNKSIYGYVITVTVVICLLLLSNFAVIIMEIVRLIKSKKQRI